MLVLTRKPSQSLYIGDGIKITVHGIRGNQVRLGIEAPDNVRIYREEIYTQILEENRSASNQDHRLEKGSNMPVSSASGFNVSGADLSGIAKAWADGRDSTLTVLKKNTKKPKHAVEQDDEDDDSNSGNF